MIYYKLKQSKRDDDDAIPSTKELIIIHVIERKQKCSTNYLKSCIYSELQ